MDLALLPTISRCWCRQGQERKVETPGCNEKRYGAGAANWMTGELVWAISDHKDNALFRDVPNQLLERHPVVDGGPVRRICVVIDNYSPPDCPRQAHYAKKVLELVAQCEDHLELVPLPTYSLILSPMDRLCKHMPRQVTHNHFFRTIKALLTAAQWFFEETAAHPAEVMIVARLAA